MIEYGLVGDYFVSNNIHIVDIKSIIRNECDRKYFANIKEKLENLYMYSRRNKGYNSLHYDLFNLVIYSFSKKEMKKLTKNSYIIVKNIYDLDLLRFETYIKKELANFMTNPALFILTIIVDIVIKDNENINEGLLTKSALH